MKGRLLPLAGKTVDGREVMDEVPNTDSISATLDDFDVMKGVRVIWMSDIEVTDPYKLFYAADDIERVKELASLIDYNKKISPLIVVIDDKGPYILEGGHRLGALHLLKAKAFPALVVLDVGSVSV